MMSQVWLQLPMPCNALGAVVGSRQLTLRPSTLVSPELELDAGDMIGIGVQGPRVTGEGQQQLYPAQFQIPGECTWFWGLW